MRSDERERKSAVLSATGGRLFFGTGTKGGCTGKKRGGVPAPHSLKSFVFRGLPLLIGFPCADTEKSGETIATPPETGVPTGPDSGTEYRASISAPGGRYRRYLSLREGSEKTPRGRGRRFRLPRPFLLLPPLKRPRHRGWTHRRSSSGTGVPGGRPDPLASLCRGLA